MTSFDNFSFANPNAALFLLIVLPLYYWLAKQDTLFNSLITSTLSPLVKKLRSGYSNSETTSRSLTLLILSLLLIVLSMMRPRWGYELVESNYKGVDIAIAVDVSDSMLAEDVSPNRLGVAKRKIKDLISETSQDRIALISSAGTSFIESPLTLDKSSIELLASTLQPDLVPLKGSSLSSLIEAANKVFSLSSSGSEISRSHALILLTDGEYEKEDLEYSEGLLENYKITPYAIIFGTEQGAPIPTGSGFKRDQKGQVVISKSDRKNIGTLFKKFNGNVVFSDPGLRDVVEIVNKGIKKTLNKEKISYQNTKNWKEYYQYPLIIGILLLLYIWRIPLKINLKIVLTILLLSRSMNVYADSNDLITRTKNQYEAGEFVEALNTISQISLIKETHASTLLKGNILYRLGNFSDAEKEFAKSASLATDANQKSNSLYNRGNALLQTGKLKEAKADYETAIRDKPKDKEIENNLNYVKKLLEDPPTKDPEQENNKENKSSDPKNENKDKNNEKSNDQKSDDQNNDKKSDPNNSKDNSNSKNNPNNSNSDKTPNQSDLDKEDKSEALPNDQNQKNVEEQNKDTSNQDSNLKQDKDSSDSDTPQSNETKNKDIMPPQSNGESQSSSNSSKSSAENTPNQKIEALNDQTLSQLDSIEEDTTSRQKYRYQKGLKELENRTLSLPKRDW